jgi:aryl-alcohol dehydrogenase-like predicted oxidoreductase
MTDDFLYTTLGRTGRRVFRLGLSASYRPGKATVHEALDQGLNYFFCYGFDTHMIKVLRELPASRRQELVVATGAYNFKWWHADVRRTCEKRLRQLRMEAIDVFLFLGVLGEKEFTERAREDLLRLRQEGKVRAIGVSTHNRKFAGELAAAGELDVLMIRYNAAHRGAEQEIFPQLAGHDPGLVSYTATRWGRLLVRPRGWPKTSPAPTAGMCYRFVLSNPHVDLSMTAPYRLQQLRDNLAEMRQGPLPEDQMQFMRDFGDAVHRRGQWFM